MTSAAHLQPRRRSPRGSVRAPVQAPVRAQQDFDQKPCPPQSAMSLRKGATFHSPASPPLPVDPTLNISSLPRRSLTSPKGLEDLIAESEKRVADIIKDFDRSISISNYSAPPEKDVLPVPRAFLAHAAAHTSFVDINDNKPSRLPRSKQSDSSKFVTTQANHHHGSDSGLGSSIGSSINDELPLVEQNQLNRRGLSERSTTSVYTSTTGAHSLLTKEGHFLDDYAVKQIKKHIVLPILGEETLSAYHTLISELPHRIAKRSIKCLRDLEKTLIFLAPSKASSPASYLNFCRIAIQCIHTTVVHLNDLDLRRPTDRPYTNTYFVDLVEQVRQYARIMAVTRQKQANGVALDKMDFSPNEKLHLRGGSGEHGKPLELVRERDGKFMPIEGGSTMSSTDAMDDTLLDDDVKRSMARKRKCDEGKVEYRSCRECGTTFTRACDLTKHEKTHTRPWKCPEVDCKYHEQGWPTEKERDRHFNDKHSKEAALFRCLWAPDCSYSSKRESNCKQHMEKAHGWVYDRAKNKQGTKLVATTQPAASQVPTPLSASAFPSLSTPTTTVSNSPATVWDDMPTLSVPSSNPSRAFEKSPFSSTGFTASDYGLSDYGLQNNGNLLSPYGSDDCPDLFNSPNTTYNHSPPNAGPSSFGFRNDFDFCDPPDTSIFDGADWSAMQQSFPSFFPSPITPGLDNNAANAKQPFGFNQNSNMGLDTSYDNMATFAGAQDQTEMNFDQTYGYVNQQQDTSALVPDFSLYSEPGNVGGESSAAGASWFPSLTPNPTLDTVGGQFGGQEESIYDDVAMPTTASTEESGFEEFFELDGPAME